MRFVGIDLAWGMKAATGMAVLDEDGRLIDVGTVRSDAEIDAWLESWIGADSLVAIDAPLIVENADGMRDCERLVGRYFGRFGVSCHASNRRNPAFVDGGRAAALARRHGLDPASRSLARRRAIEVYPHTAIVQLFRLDRILQYKHKSGRDLASLRASLLRLVGMIEALESATPALVVRDHPEWRQMCRRIEVAPTKAALRRDEDAVDAVICAYVALLHSQAPERTRILGDDQGYIVTPVDETTAEMIDTEGAPRQASALPTKSTPLSEPTNGHVFVTRGVIENIVHDAVVVPTDSRFSLRKYWYPALGLEPSNPAEILRPHSWGTGPRAGRSPDDRPIWFLDVGRDHGEGIDWLADGVREVLKAVAAAGLRPARGRVRPLVLLPMVGIGGGGFGPRQGEAITSVLEAAQQVAASVGIDVAFVVKDQAAYAAVQHLRRHRDEWPLGDESITTAKRLGDQARSGELALFLGAGVSIPAGLPSWSALVEAGLSKLDGVPVQGAQDLTALDQAELIARHDPEVLREVVVERCSAQRHALAHALLSAMGCAEVVTTNFDQCFELADTDKHVTVLPWSAPNPQHPWLLKMHGSVDHPESIVLTRGDFATYDARYRPAASVLQSLILTRHVLFVGASMTDDNVLRLAYEVSRLRQDHKISHHWGTVLDVENSEAKKALYAQDLSWATFSGASLEERARELEILLDVVACYATDDSSWLLDERFSALLGEFRDLGEDLRDLAARVAAAACVDPAWASLRDALRGHGAIA